MVKFDVLVALDVKTGREIAHWDFSGMTKEIEKDLGKPMPLAPCYAFPGMPDINFEVSHFNSINFVPEYYRKDMDLIVNTGRGLILFFTKELDYVGKFWVDKAWVVNSHDAQINEEGNLILYRNFDQFYKDSFLEIRSLINNNVLWAYYNDPEGKRFKAERFGSVQFFSDESFLYTDMENGGHFTTVDKEGKKINDFYYPELDPHTQRPVMFHTIRREEYESLSPEIQEMLDKEIDQLFLGKTFLILRKLF